MTATLREQAECIKLVGLNTAGHLANLRRNPRRHAEAQIIEQRLPVLRDAFVTIDRAAKDAGQ